MKCTVLMGSPNRDGNTAALLKPFLEELTALGVQWEMNRLYEQDILPCLGCKVCQDVMDDFGCVRQDDVRSIYQKILDSDLTIFATPIYGWYCTAPMKAAMDRLIYAGCKYYGARRGGSTLVGKRAATIVTCGYPPEKGADVWESGLKRWCKHCGMDYLGMFCHRDLGRKDEFMNDRTAGEVRAFARTLAGSVRNG